MLRHSIWILLFGTLALQVQGTAAAVWIIGENKISFYSPARGFQVYEGIPTENSLIDSKTCALWVQSKKHILKILPDFQIQTALPTSESLLGSEVLDGVFLTTSDEVWTLRDSNGNPIRQFSSLVSEPVALQGSRQGGFWSLQFEKKQNRLELIHFTAHGQTVWSKTISKNVELWSQPKLTFIPELDQIWIGYTASSTSHAYSPFVEVWTSSGERLNTFTFPDRGLLLDTCATQNLDFLISRDIPSSPYTVPLFSFLELLTPSTKPKFLYQASDNYLINSVECQFGMVWMLQKSVLGGQSSFLVELSPSMQEKTVLPLKEPAWKIHACSLQ